jgi:hypothetical protein
VLVGDCTGEAGLGVRLSTVVCSVAESHIVIIHSKIQRVVQSRRTYRSCLDFVHEGDGQLEKDRYVAFHDGVPQGTLLEYSSRLDVGNPGTGVEYELVH